jgi:hypothetical protein
MPVIDLDAPRPAAVRRDPRERSRPLLLALAGTMLLLVAGEPVAATSPLDVPTVCREMPPVPGREDEPVTLAVLDPRSGDIVQVFTCPARRSAGRR